LSRERPGQYRGDGKRAHNQANLGFRAMQFLNDKERQDGKEQEHACGKEKSADTQQHVISSEKGLLRSLVRGKLW
jgi:hypothetical protein